MTSKYEVAPKPRNVKIYELDEFERLINGLKVAACMLSESHQVVDEQSVIRRLSALTLNGPSDGNCCSCCGVGPFETRAEQTAHYKHHWHTHNLKRKLFGKQPLTLGQFNSRIDDDSSVSGSDSESEDTGNITNDLFAAATRHCKAFFTNKHSQVFCIYRCLLHHRKEELSTDGDGHTWVERCLQLAIPGFQRWAILMVSGGLFAGAVFSGSVPVLHKTHRSYVTRRGQGATQASRDQHGPAPRSAGASLRRYNQAQFLEHVQETIVSWSKDLKECFLVFYRAVGHLNQAAVFGKNSPISRDDPRVRALPFPTKKPSFKEIKRVHETIASLEVYDSMELFQKALIASTTKFTTKTSSTAGNTEKLKKNSPNKVINRAKSRERAPRELPTQTASSEDEGPSYIDSETPAGWTQTLLQQSEKKLPVGSREDLLKDSPETRSVSATSTDTEVDVTTDSLEKAKKKIKKEANKDNKSGSKPNPKKKLTQISKNVKKLWKSIEDSSVTTLAPILEAWEGAELEAACNTQDPGDGNTALHKAAIASKPDMITQLLSVGGDPCIRNGLLQTPYAATPHREARLAFRLFRGEHPHKYNYAKSQIPDPITPEMVELEKEKKAQQKKAKRQRDREKQIEKIKTSKFLMLTDQEKILSEHCRCFLCGLCLPKKPFEYDKYRFCSVPCLQNHRNLRPLKMSA